MTDNHADTAVDAKGRPRPETMTDRDLLVEVVTAMREVGDALAELSETPMMKAMSSGSGLMGLMRA